MNAAKSYSTLKGNIAYEVETYFTSHSYKLAKKFESWFGCDCVSLSRLTLINNT